MRKNSVFITGGAGFIGRALVAQCLKEENEVTVIDNLCAGRLENLAPYLNSITFCQADILDRPAIKAAMEKAQPSMVFHLAAHHFIPFCELNPSETLRVNVEGTHSVLTEAAHQNVDVAVVASSGSLYESRTDLLSEKFPAMPVDVYGLSKHLAEEVTRFAVNTTSLRCVTARLFNTYGPYETNPHLIPHIMDSLRCGPQVRLGNIHTKRDYIYVDDVAACLYQCALRAEEAYTVVNVGTGTEYSAEEIVQTIGRLLGQRIMIDVDKSRVRAIDKLHQRADTERLEKLTCMRPAHSLTDGLDKLLKHEGIRL